jgi:glucose-6-phosphate isomerase
MPFPYTQDLRHCFEPSLRAQDLARTAPTLARLKAVVGSGQYAFLDQPDRRDDLAAIREAAARFDGFDTVLLLGTGGSSLGARTLAALVDGGLGLWKRGGRRLVVAENVDPFGFEKLLAAVDLKSTGVLAISKSGGTAETLAQLHALLPHLAASVGAAKIAKHVTIVTEPTDNALRRIADRFALPTLPHPPTLGGRYSVLSAVGLLPACLLGLDIEALRAGAAQARDAALAEPETSLPAHGAALAVALAAQGHTQTVFCAYADILGPFGQWYAQLWAESLGKGGKGTTPLRAVGTVDQHSQLQLWLDGPADKLFTIVSQTSRDKGPRYDAATLADPALGYLAGRTMGDILDVAARATAETLARRGRPVRLMHVETLDETSLGALLMHFMLETVIAADLFGIEPYEQPAVEEGKILARRYLQGMAPQASDAS